MQGCDGDGQKPGGCVLAMSVLFGPIRHDRLASEERPGKGRERGLAGCTV